MEHTIEDTLSRGICIGCGACSVVTGGAIPLTLNRYGMYSPELGAAGNADRGRASRVCPFSDDSPDEDALGAPTEEGRALPKDPRLGHYSRTLAGRHRSDEYLSGSSSGGLTSWLLGQLLERDLVDAVIHVGRTGDNGRLFQYTISRDAETVNAQRKSQYYPTTLTEVLDEVGKEDQRYAFVGVPCFVKAVRLLCREDADLARNIKYFVGLVCGHLKTSFFAESLAWQVGVPPDALSDVDFRLKNQSRDSSDYDFGAKREGESEFVRRRTHELVGGNWGHAAFQPEACNFCDDVLAETADVVFGDAWLPRFTKDWRGTNVIVTRNTELDAVFDAGAAGGEIELVDLTAEEVATSQAGGFRHRREGMAVRLADDIGAGLSVPTKRVTPGVRVSGRRAALIRQRRLLSKVSLEAFAQAREFGNLDYYLIPMTTEVETYRRLERRQALQQKAARVWPKAKSVMAAVKESLT